jgi:hypothetical protein
MISVYKFPNYKLSPQALNAATLLMVLREIKEKYIRITSCLLQATYN